MVITTREQRKTLFKIYGRCPIYASKEDARVGHQMSYREWRKGVQPTFGCDGAVAVAWAGMWVCVERDGYAHT